MFFVPSEEEVFQYIDDLSNWGKWGESDELGTLNYLTPELKLKAIASVKEGRSISCSRPIEFFLKTKDVVFQATRFMVETGQGRDEDDEHCNSVNSKRSASKEQISMVFHGFTITHLDSFAHFSFKGKMYNNRIASLVDSTKGAFKNGIEALKDGIIARGVLLDIPKLKGKEWLDLSEGVFPEDLDAAEKAFDVEVGTGDILLVRTGFLKRRSCVGPVDPPVDGAPALHAACMPWLKRKEVILLGSDTPNDIYPPSYKMIKQPIHVISLVSMGLWLLDNANLEELSIECEKRGRYHFLMTINPLNMQGTTGSPVNPIAIF